MNRYFCFALIGLFISLPAFADEGLQFHDREFFKQGYFEYNPTNQKATHKVSKPDDTKSCISSGSTFHVRLETAYFVTKLNPDRWPGFMKFPVIGKWRHNRKNDLGLFMTVAMDNKIGPSEDSAYIPVYLSRETRFVAGTHIGSPNRLLYLANNYDGKKPVHIQVRLIDFDSSDIDAEFRVWQDLMNYSESVIAASSDPAIIALGALGKSLVERSGRNDILGEYDLTVLPCDTTTGLPQPPLAEGYLVMVLDEPRNFVYKGKDADERRRRADVMAHDLNWRKFVYDPYTKALQWNLGVHCKATDGKRLSKVRVEKADDCKTYKEVHRIKKGLFSKAEDTEVTFSQAAGSEETVPFTERTYVVLSVTRATP